MIRAIAPKTVTVLGGLVLATAIVLPPTTRAQHPATFPGPRPGAAHVVTILSKDNVNPAERPITTTNLKTAKPVQLRVNGLTRFFVTPNQSAVLSWKFTGPAISRTWRWNITNYWGRAVTAGTLTVADANDTINLPVRLPRGFYQVDFPSTGQKFGVVSLAAHHGPAGHFFSIDSALSWLVNHPATRQAVRAGMIKILRRSGIGLSRERLRWSQINPAPGKFDWNKDCQYGRLAGDYFHNGVRMLQILGSAPAWSQVPSSGRYPINLVQTERSWTVIGSYFHSDWGALEMWNEPDMRNLPPDQLLPTVKTIAYSFQRADIHIPLVGGVFALFLSGHFQRDCALNGLLDQVNAISFHNYFPPVRLCRAVQDYRRWLKSFGKESMPLWITESGKPWPAGTARPHRGPAMTSALWITMKAVEARACGIARYFAFVYPFYTEHDATYNNFGMMGQEHTPLRSMAAYVNCVAELSGWSYAGNLKITDHAVLLAPVFAKGNRRTTVIYTGKADPHAALHLALRHISIRGIDGRKLHRTATGAIPIPDGLVYVRGPAKAFTGQVKTDTEAGRLYAISRRPPPKLQRHSPIILQFDDQGDDRSKQGYMLTDNPGTLIRVRAWNLADHAMTIKLMLWRRHANHHELLASSIWRRIPAQGDVLVQWGFRHLAREMGLGIVHYHYLMVTGRAMPATTNTPVISPLAISIRLKGGLSQYLVRYPHHMRLAIGNLARWRKNAAAKANVSFFSSKAGGWGMKVVFHGGNCWAFPQFPLPGGIGAENVVGVLLRARAANPAKVRLLVFKPGLPAYGTLASPIIAANGKWHTVLVPLSRLNPMGKGPAHLHSLAGAKFISVGLNNGNATGRNKLEVSKLYLVYRR